MKSREKETIHLPDCAAVAEVLADAQPRPVLLLDRAGFVRLVNRAGVEFLAMSRSRIVGRHFRDLCLHPRDPDRFKDALRGAVRRVEHDVKTTSNQHLRLVLDLSPVGRGRSKGLVVTVLNSTLLGTGSALPEDLDYEISSNLVDFGRLLRVVAAGRTVPYLAGSYCHEALKSVKTPCSDCPVLRPEGGWPRVSVRALGGANGYEVVSATPHNSSIGMKFRRLPGDVLSAIFESRIGELAARADLTERERAVLKYLVMGRYLSDISTILGISLRTVKFHQGNILRKVGADSRVDLMRLMM